MSKVVAIEHISLDGVIQAPARADEDRRHGFTQGGWANAGNDPAMQRAIGAYTSAGWSLLMGRVTYDDLYGHWPKQKDNPIARSLDNVEKFVASNTLQELTWQNSSFLRGDAADGVAELKRGSDKTFVIFGSGMLVQALLRRDLIDELVLMIHPLVLGRGIRLFGEHGTPAKFTLDQCTALDTGVILATWKRRTEPQM